MGERRKMAINGVLLRYSIKLTDMMMVKSDRKTDERISMSVVEQDLAVAIAAIVR